MDQLNPKQFALGGCFLAVLMVASVLGMARQFGLLGFAIGVDLCTVFCVVASFSNAPTLYPISDRRLTMLEIGILVAICFVLHGLAFPAVQSRPHRAHVIAPAAPAPTAPVAPETTIEDRP